MKIQKDVIRENGLRVTPARAAVLHVLLNSSKPLDIGAINFQVAKLKVNADQATIYRIIENFIVKDLVSRIQFKQKKFYYEAKGKEHHHAVCDKCGNIEDVSQCSVPRLEREIEKTKGFKVLSHSLEFYGLCASCQQV